MDVTEVSSSISAGRSVPESRRIPDIDQGDIQTEDEYKFAIGRTVVKEFTEPLRTTLGNPHFGDARLYSGDLEEEYVDAEERIRKNGGRYFEIPIQILEQQAEAAEERALNGAVADQDISVSTPESISPEVPRSPAVSDTLKTPMPPAKTSGGILGSVKRAFRR